MPNVRSGIVSGEKNAAAIEFARREHFDAVLTGVGDKRSAVDALAERAGIAADAIACVFDDINDLSMAERCGLRFMVGRDGSPLLGDYAQRNGLVDYLTGSANPVREVCELALGIMGRYDEIIASRVAFDDDYRRYWAARQAVATVTPGTPVVATERRAQS